MPRNHDIEFAREKYANYTYHDEEARPPSQIKENEYQDSPLRHSENGGIKTEILSDTVHYIEKRRQHNTENNERIAHIKS